MVPLGSAGYIVKSKVTSENTFAGTFFLAVLSEGTYGNLFYCTYYFLQEAIFLATNSFQNISRKSLTKKRLPIGMKIFLMKLLFVLLFSWYRR
jgi:hypothetical protein